MTYAEFLLQQRSLCNNETSFTTRSRFAHASYARYCVCVISEPICESICIHLYKTVPKVQSQINSIIVCLPKVKANGMYNIDVQHFVCGLSLHSVIKWLSIAHTKTTSEPAPIATSNTSFIDDGVVEVGAAILRAIYLRSLARSGRSQKDSIDADLIGGDRLRFLVLEQCCQKTHDLTYKQRPKYTNDHQNTAAGQT